MRMNFIEVLEGVWQLVENCGGGTAIHLVDMVSLEGIDEAFRHAVRLRAADWRVGRRQTQLFGNGMRLMGR